MGILDRFRKPGTPPRPQDLLNALLDAFARQDFPALMPLINDNSDTIRSQFKSWTTLPESVRNDPAAVDRYARMLFTLAQLFERSGDPSLKEWLARDNPVTKCEKDMDRASGLIDSGQALEAVPILRAVLDQVSKVTGPWADSIRARALGRLGIALWKTGDTTEATRVTHEALELCRKMGDTEGIEAYLKNLKEIGRCEIGKGDETDGGVDVVFTDAEGRALTPEDLPTARGTIRYEVRHGGMHNPDAARLHEAGRAAGAKGDLDQAIALLTQASELAPSWPYPIYDRAFSHLLKQEFDLALADYRRTLELSPRGFFIARQTADMLEREAAGEFPSGLSIGVASLPNMPTDQQRVIAEQLIQKFPTCPAGWALHANFVTDQVARLAAIENGLAARPDPDTRGSLLIGKALAFQKLGQTDRALEILESLTARVGDSVSTYAGAFVALAVTREQHTDSS